MVPLSYGPPRCRADSATYPAGNPAKRDRSGGHSRTTRRVSSFGSAACGNVISAARAGDSKTQPVDHFASLIPFRMSRSGHASLPTAQHHEERRPMATKSSRTPATPAASPAEKDPAESSPVQGSLASEQGQQNGPFLTTAQGVRLPDTDHSLKAGPRGPALLEDFHLREKITHFDHERIPERVVHARGAAAHGTFRAYGNAESVTKAGFLAKG